MHFWETTTEALFKIVKMVGVHSKCLTPKDVSGDESMSINIMKYTKSIKRIILYCNYCFLRPPEHYNLIMFHRVDMVASKTVHYIEERIVPMTINHR